MYCSTVVENLFRTTHIQDNANVTLTLGRYLPRPAENLAESMESSEKILMWMGMSLLFVRLCNQ